MNKPVVEREHIHRLTEGKFCNEYLLYYSGRNLAAEGCDIQCATLSNCILVSCKLTYCELNNCKIQDCLVLKSNLDKVGSSVSGMTYVKESTARDVQFSAGVKIESTKITRSQAKCCRLKECKSLNTELHRVTARKCELSNCKVSKSRLSHTTVYECSLESSLLHPKCTQASAPFALQKLPFELRTLIFHATVAVDSSVLLAAVRCNSQLHKEVIQVIFDSKPLKVTPESLAIMKRGDHPGKMYGVPTKVARNIRIIKIEPIGPKTRMSPGYLHTHKFPELLRIATAVRCLELDFLDSNFIICRQNLFDIARVWIANFGTISRLSVTFHSSKQESSTAAIERVDKHLKVKGRKSHLDADTTTWTWRSLGGGTLIWMITGVILCEGWLTQQKTGEENERIKFFRATLATHPWSHNMATRAFAPPHVDFDKEMAKMVLRDPVFTFISASSVFDARSMAILEETTLTGPEQHDPQELQVVHRHNLQQYS
ncbi:hypothetical protein DL98DRAFT_657129 [Cadophora sp. DSE1049]|nr:hypothetical protein DL98DRAFT_657129 [Cadophora sp. DSE1049]